MTCPLCFEHAQLIDLRKHIDNAHEHEMIQRKKNPKDTMVKWVRWLDKMIKEG